MNTEQFCRGFLLGRYGHLHDILDEYGEMFLQIDLHDILGDKETFAAGFSTICFDVLRTRGNGRGYVLAILGFASHVNTQHRNFEWYDTETLVGTLTDILTCINFNSSDYCKKHFSCIIL